MYKICRKKCEKMETKMEKMLNEYLMTSNPKILEMLCAMPATAPTPEGAKASVQFLEMIFGELEANEGMDL